MPLVLYFTHNVGNNTIALFFPGIVELLKGGEGSQTGPDRHGQPPRCCGRQEELIWGWRCLEPKLHQRLPIQGRPRTFTKCQFNDLYWLCIIILTSQKTLTSNLLLSQNYMQGNAFLKSWRSSSPKHLCVSYLKDFEKAEQNSTLFVTFCSLFLITPQ